MPIVDVEVDIEVFCANCGKGLCMLSSGGNGLVEVDPCPDCLAVAVEEAKDEGYHEGWAQCRSSLEIS